ncbi:hypothetical protein niasHT_000159 [Heterodera trifolii]|uniref:Protein kinase domain-containing protein n=1 Tax=Heterodera trifolii TaxID=157864 RepID=A0ABD2LQ89_9BILA
MPSDGATTIADRQLRTGNCGPAIADRTFADDNCGRQLRTVLLRTTIADRTFADDNCGRQLRTVLLRTTIADRTFADDNCGRQLRTGNCGPYFCQKINWKVNFLAKVRSAIVVRNCRPQKYGPQLSSAKVRSAIVVRNCRPQKYGPQLSSAIVVRKSTVRNCRPQLSSAKVRSAIVVRNCRTQLSGPQLPLDHLRKNGPVDEATCRGWILQLTKALAYLHRKRIVHRDLKLENILVYSDEQLKLLDFGFARTPDELSTSFCESKAFKAPELLQTRDYDPFKADVWTLGIVCYILLTDTFPFDIAKDLF